MIEIVLSSAYTIIIVSKVSGGLFINFFIFNEFFVLSAGFLVLLVLGDQIVHVGFSFSKFHFVHALSGVPMQGSLATEHGSELFRNPLKQLLDGSGVTDEGASHFQPTGRNVTDGRLDVVGDPFDEVGTVFVLDVKHLLIHLLHGHSASEDGGHGQVASMTGITGGHHVLGIEHLLSQLGYCQSPVLLTATSS